MRETKPSTKTESPTKKRINSRQKGAQGEREFAAYLRKYGHSARRGQQFCGIGEAPDVISSLPVHWEVKRVQKVSIKDWLAQAAKDAKLGRFPIVAHRRNGESWCFIMDAAIGMELLEVAYGKVHVEEEA